MLSELKLLQGGGKGMMLIDLKEGDELTACTVVSQPALTLSGAAGSKVQQLRIGGKELKDYFGARARAGKVVETKLKGTQSTGVEFFSPLPKPRDSTSIP